MGDVAAAARTGIASGNHQVAQAIVGRRGLVGIHAEVRQADIGIPAVDVHTVDT